MNEYVKYEENGEEYTAEVVNSFKGRVKIRKATGIVTHINTDQVIQYYDEDDDRPELQDRTMF